VLFPKFPWNFELWKMPRRTGNAAPTKSVELVKQDQLEFDDPDEVDDEEEVEYEEIEEEVEYEEVEEEEEEDEDEEDEEMEGVHEIDANDESKMVDADGKVENEKEKHAELLALPPHGAEVYVGGISSDVSSEDLKQLFESVGEVVEVSTASFSGLAFAFLLSANLESHFFLQVRMRGKGDNRTYAFINFRTKAMALKAIQNLSNKDLKVSFHLNSRVDLQVIPCQ
jgi:heterogeneous nuclear ribonucleoprotein R